MLGYTPEGERAVVGVITSSVERKSYGVASRTPSTMRVIGQMLSMGIATLIFAVYIGHVQINVASTQLFLKSIEVAFAVFAVLCFGGVFASLARGKLR